MELRPIRSKLAALRSRVRRIIFARGAMRLVVVAGAVAAATFVLDWIFHLPHAARVVTWAVSLGLIAHTAWSRLIRPAALPLDDAALALLVEKRHPALDGRLITALDFADRLARGDDGGESRELMTITIREGEALAERIDFADAVSARSLRRPAAASLLVVLAWTLFAVALPAQTALWFSRCVLLQDQPWPPRTTLEVRITNVGQFRQKIGSDGVHEIWVPESSVLRVEVEARGEVPDSVRLRKFALPRADNPAPVTIDMPARPGSPLFEYKFGRVATSFEFFVQGGDDVDETPTFRIHVRSAPRIDTLLVDYDLPDYVNAAGRPDRTGVREYNVVAPKGTAVTMTFGVSAPLDDFSLVLDGNEDEAVHLEEVPGEPLVRRWHTVLDRDRFYTWKLLGENGAPSRPAPDFNVVAQPDLPPQLVMAMPDSVSIDVSERAVVPIELRVSDDWGVAAVELRRDQEHEGAYAERVPLGEGDLIDPDGRRRELTAFLPLEVATLTIPDAAGPRPPRPGDTIYLRMEARDARSTVLDPEPNVTVHPTPLALNLREPAEIERELSRGQVRTKELVERAQEAVQARLDEIDAMLNAGEGSGIGTAALHDLLAGHALITSSLGEAARGYVRTFDGHLFNRTDPSALTERLIADVIARHREGGAAHHEHVRLSLAENRRTIDDGEPMGKVALIADRLFVAADVASPAVDEMIRAAIAADGTDALFQALQDVRERELQLQERLEQLLGRMRDWEDFQDVIQSLKDILDLQRGLWSRVKTLER